MVITTFAMDLSLYLDLNDPYTANEALENFRHMLRVAKGHPAVLMWAIGNEPNSRSSPTSYVYGLDAFFAFLEQLRHVRDDEEAFGGYHPHPLLVPMADTGTFPAEVARYDHAQHDVWGVQAYRGATFGTLFQTYVSAKPLLVSEYGMDAYVDVIYDAAGADLRIDPHNLRAGEAQQAAVVPALAGEIEAQDPRRADLVFALTTLLRGAAPDEGGGYAVFTYDRYTRYLSYALHHRTFEPGFIRLEIPQLLNVSDLDAVANDTVPLDPPSPAPVNTTAPGATCQTAQGLSLCAQWNGVPIGTCYALEDIDALAARVMEAFGGGACAHEWACASVTACYFSPDPRHWCRHVDKGTCFAAFTACGRSHVSVPDFPPALAADGAAAPMADGWIDPDTPANARTKTVEGEELQLVFSDEFGDAARDLRVGRDAKWEAMDMRREEPYRGGCVAAESVRLSGGRAVLAAGRNTTYHASDGACAFRSALLHSWDKFCFTGGYVEVKVRQPGTLEGAGVQAAVRLVGDLALVGGLNATPGLWPFSYGHCDAVARDGQADWPNSRVGAQRHSACGGGGEYGFAPGVGRGAPEVALFEMAAPAAALGGATLRTALLLAPKIPPNTTHGAGLTGDCAAPGDACTGLRVHLGAGYKTALDLRCMSGGDDARRDCVGAASLLSATHFEAAHRYAVLLEPGAAAAWYLDDARVFDVARAALTRKTNPHNATQTVGSRDVPLEPLYIAMGLGPHDSDLAGPVQMEVEWVRVYQAPARHSVGCSPAAYPTAEYIAAHPNAFGMAMCGDGRCAPGECERCPSDCLRAVACRRDCAVPRCQVRDGSFAAGAAHWAVQSDPADVTVAVQWRAGDVGMAVTLEGGFSDGWGVNVTQSDLLLCQGYRYRVTVRLRALGGSGRVALVVTGGAENGFVDLLPDRVTAPLTSEPITVTADFEVQRRWGRAELALQFDATNDGRTLDVYSVSLCPVPSRLQYCEAGPRQSPSSPLEVFTQGQGRVQVTDRSTAQAAFGVASFVRGDLPDYSAFMTSSEDSPNQPTGQVLAGHAARAPLPPGHTARARPPGTPHAHSPRHTQCPARPRGAPPARWPVPQRVLKWGGVLQEFHCPLPPTGVVLHCRSSTASCPQVLWRCIARVPQPAARRQYGGELQEFQCPLPPGGVVLHFRGSTATSPRR